MREAFLMADSMIWLITAIFGFGLVATWPGMRLFCQSLLIPRLEKTNSAAASANRTISLPSMANDVLYPHNRFCIEPINCDGD